MKEKTEDLVKLWLKKASDDLKVAVRLFESGDYEPDATEASAAVVHAKKVHRVLRKDLRTARSKIAG